MKKSEKFLALYKEYETILRDNGIDTKEYEESRAGSDSYDRLRMCRTFRNFFSHKNDAAFLDVSDKQISFLEDTIRELKYSGDVVKKHLKTPAAATCLPTDKCTVALEKLIKLKTDKIVVVEKEGYAVADIYSLIAAQLSSKTAKVCDTKLTKGYKSVRPDFEYAKLPGSGVFVCEEPNKDNKLLGVIYR